MTCLPWVYRHARAWPSSLEVCTTATNAHQLCAVNLTYFYLTLLTRTVAVSLGGIALFKINAYTNCKISWCFRRLQQIYYCCQWFTNNRRRMVTSVLSVVADSLYWACHYTHCRRFVRWYRLAQDKCVKSARFIDILCALDKFTIDVNVSLSIGDVWWRAPSVDANALCWVVWHVQLRK